MNKNQRRRRMKAKRRETRFLFGVNRVYQLKPRTGTAVQMLVEQAMERVVGPIAARMLGHLRGMGLDEIIADRSQADEEARLGE